MTPHDALVEARLDEFHLIAHAARPTAGPMTEGTPTGEGWIAVDLMTVDPWTIGSLRVRLGRGLVALGAAIAGDGDRDRARRAA